jgi:hypothetical protein
MVVALLGGGAVVAAVLRSSDPRRGFPRDPESPSQTSIPGSDPGTATTASPAPAGAASLPAPGGTLTPAGATTSPPTGTGSPAAPTAEPAVPVPDAKDPARAAALFKKAEARRGRQEADAAIPLYLAALEADPSLAEAHKKLALCYQLRGDRRRAAEQYRRYLATKPPDAERVRTILGTLE